MKKTGSVIPHIEVKGLLEVVEEEKIPRRLDYIYDQAPTHDCGVCAECCFACAQIYPIEFLNILSYLITLPELTQARLARKVIEYEMLHLTTLEHTCPWLENNACIIASRKPLVCRYFGLYPEAEYKEMLAKSREENEKLAMGYAKYHRILLPEDVMTYDVEQCQVNEAAEGELKVATAQERQRLHQQIYSLSEQTMPDAWLSAELQRFSFQYALFYFNEDEMEEARLDIIKEFQASGSSTTLEKLIAKHGFCF